MFEGEEYRSYIQLCRELRLEREFELVDVVHYSGDGADAVDVIAWDDNRDPERTASGVYWLPRLDQWLSMLEETGVQWWRCVGPSGSPEVQWWFEGGRPSQQWEGLGATREEACARLYLAVTGKTVTSG